MTIKQALESYINRAKQAGIVTSANEGEIRDDLEAKIAECGCEASEIVEALNSDII